MIYIVVCLISVGIYCLIAPKLNFVDLTNTSLNGELGISRTKLAVVCASAPVTFITAVRFGVGTDYFNTYIGGYWRVLSGWTGDQFEFGYSLLLHALFKIFPQNPNALIVVTSIIFIGFTYMGILHSSVNIPFSIVLFFVTRYYFIGMNGVRQFMAMSIMLFSLKYVVDKKPLNYLLCALVAIGFHTSIIIFVPVFFFTKFSLSKKVLPIVIGLDLALIAGGYKLLYGMLRGTRYYRLTQSYGLAGRNFTLIMIFINIIILVSYYVIYPKMRDDAQYRLYSNIQLVAFLLTLLLRTIPQIERVYWIFSYPIILGLPYVISKYSNRMIRIIVGCGIVFLLGIYCYYDISVLRDHQVLPYHWIFR